MSKPVSVRLPDDVREAIGDVESLSAWLVDAARQRLAQQGSDRRWRPLLGDALADRVSRVAPTDPAAFCLTAIEVGTARAEAARAAATVTARARAQCAHPEAERRGNRCGKCGVRGLPAVSKLPAAKPTGGRR